MALIVIRDFGKDLNEGNAGKQAYSLFCITASTYSDPKQVQHDFCRLIEKEKNFGTPFLEAPCIKEYLAQFGVSYKGNYILESDDWGDLGSPNREQFVTYLNYPLQLCCLALYNERVNFVIDNHCLFDFPHLLPVLQKRDIYLKLENDTELVDYIDFDVVKSGIEIKIAGKSSKDMTEDEFMEFLHKLAMHSGYLTRELDAEVFPEDFKEKYIFEPTEMSLEDYIQSAEQGGIPDSAFEFLLEKDPGYADTRVLINGINSYTGTWRKYPIHALFYMDGEWKYISYNSVKNPMLGELLTDALFADTVFDYDAQCEIDVTSASKVMALVLDCDEICDATKYWENVAFVAKFDKQENVVEICDKNRGIFEFHELLQKSADLKADKK